MLRLSARLVHPPRLQAQILDESMTFVFLELQISGNSFQHGGRGITPGLWLYHDTRRKVELKIGLKALAKVAYRMDDLGLPRSDTIELIFAFYFISNIPREILNLSYGLTKGWRPTHITTCNLAFPAGPIITAEGKRSNGYRHNTGDTNPMVCPRHHETD